MKTTKTTILIGSQLYSMHGSVQCQQNQTFFSGELVPKHSGALWGAEKRQGALFKTEGERGSVHEMRGEGMEDVG